MILFLCLSVAVGAFLILKGENMLIKTIPVGPLESNCYVMADEETKQAIIVDPGDEPDMILEQAEGLKVLYIVLTHAHFDHIGAVNDIKEATGAEVALHEADSQIYESAKEHAAFWGFTLEPPAPPDILLHEGDELLVGGLSFAVIHTPGHSPGSICLYTDGTVITGDTLFAGSVGRTDLPGGDIKQMKKSFRRLLSLPDDTTVLPGHGSSTTIGIEKEHNMFVAEFLQ